MLGRFDSVLGFFRGDRNGAVAVEFATAGMLLVLGVLNAVDMGLYEYKRMEVENAAQVGAQSAWKTWKTCNDQGSILPATVNCSGLKAAITAAIQSSTLGTAVSLASGYPTEGYYCVNSAGNLQAVGTLSSPPSDCSAVGSAKTTPGDYIQVEVIYSYAPLFGITVMSMWGVSSVNATSWMRLG